MGRLELLARANRFHINMVYIQTAYLPKCFGIKSDRNFIVFCDLRRCCCCCSCLVIFFFFASLSRSVFVLMAFYLFHYIISHSTSFPAVYVCTILNWPFSLDCRMLVERNAAPLSYFFFI